MKNIPDYQLLEKGHKLSFHIKLFAENMKPNLKGTHKTAILTVFCLLLFYATNAFSTGFMTEDDFLKDESRYKDYPIKLLFKKLSESDESEKSTIRNYIILKQVFSTKEMKPDEKRIFDYKESFGLVKEINKGKLKLWLPATNEIKEFFLGIDFIPTEVSEKYEIMESNIGEHGCIVYSIDDRVYKIKILFLVKAPDNHYVDRKDENNILSWSEAVDDTRPSKYKVFRNGELYKTVEDKSLIIPRAKGIIDNYYVKSIYDYNNVILESNPSATIHDEITAKERQNKITATEVYESIIAAIEKNDLSRAKTILYDKRELLNLYLDEKQKGNTTLLIRFFDYIDEGDRALSEKAEDIAAIDRAVSIYKKAGELEKDLPQSISIASLAESKIAQSLDKRKILETRNREQLAAGTYEGIIEDINSEQYPKAIQSIENNRAFLMEFLSPEKQEFTNSISGFLKLINEADIILKDKPDQADSIDRAVDLYRKAMELEKDLPQNISITSLVESKINRSLDKKKILETRNREQLAAGTYEGIIEDINSEQYPKAIQSIENNRAFLMEFLSPEKQEFSNRISGFLKLINEADSMLKDKPDQIDSIDRAVDLYRKAMDLEKDLPQNITITSLVESKINRSLDKKKILETKNREQLAAGTYEGIIAAINPEDYEKSRKLLFENKTLFDDYLDEDNKITTSILEEIFNSIDEGDKHSLEQPDSLRNINMALRSYEKAARTAEELPSGINVVSITDLKINASLERKNILERQLDEKNAQDTYLKILSLLTPLEWEKGKSLILSGNDLLSQHLPPQRLDTINSLKSIFELIEDGDRQRNMTPETRENLDTALNFYSQANELADNISSVVNVRFASDQKIKESLNRKKQLEIRSKRNLARERYEEIIDLLSSRNWGKGKDLLVEHRLFLTDYLDDFLKDNMERLTVFFNDIKDGDSLLNKRPETIDNLENAFTYYKKAEQRTNDLPEGVDLKFITEDKILLYRENKKRLEEKIRNKEALAASKRKEEATPITASRDSGITIIPSSDIPISKEDIEKTARTALNHFDKRNYAKAWDNFNIAYRKQIARIQRGGRNRIIGALALPSKYRAEIFFLIEHDKINKSMKGEKITSDDLEEIKDNIDSGSGLWVLIKDQSKKKKIKRHISYFRK